MVLHRTGKSMARRERKRWRELGLFAGVNWCRSTCNSGRSLKVCCDACYYFHTTKDLNNLSVQNVDVKKSFGTSVKTWRKRLGISQEELAERAELHRTYVSDVERGARNLSLESITRVARALHIGVADLFPAEGSMTEAPPRTGGHGEELVDILLVEDNADDVALTLHAFKQARISNRVQVATDGREALDYLFCEGKYTGRQSGHPQMVLLDLYLPHVSGLEVLRRIKADERTREIPVVILTISQVFSDFAECQRLGAQTYIIKPLNFQRLSQITPRLNLDWALLKPATSP